MAPSLLQQRRTHNTLLFQKLLNLRDGASPFTLVLDTLEQSGGPIVREFARRAKISKSKIIFISYATLQKKISFEIDVFISARRKSLASIRSEILSHIPQPPASTTMPIKTLLIIDTLIPLSTTHPTHLSSFLSSLLIPPQVSLLATYHTDIPIPTTILSTVRQSTQAQILPYLPTTLTTLTYLATALLTTTSFSQTLARKRARDKSLQEPSFGLAEHREGIISSIKLPLSISTSGAGGNDGLGLGGEEGAAVVRMEIRRRSGRGVVEDFVLIPPTASALTTTTTREKTSNLSTIVLLDTHPLYTSLPLSHIQQSEQDEGVETTFNLGLTEKQKRDREGVVLPYFDAQKGDGSGEGGRILYEMGVEDREDFDDEEDEI